MNIFRKMFCRIYQGVFYIVMPLLPWRQPKIVTGKNSLSLLPDMLQSEKATNVLIVTDMGIRKAGLLDILTKILDESEISYSLFDKTVANPTIANIEEALELYHSKKCTAIVALGGGSAMDCAKGVGARVARPKKPVSKMKGVLKVGRTLPPLFAIPTTAGTGSECTIAAVITNPDTHEKYAVNDLHLIPKYAVLDPLLTENLPKHITSTTGMDALTHAVEAYIGKGNVKSTRKNAELATQLIFENLLKAYDNGSDLVARENMLVASYRAGLAFTRAYVGYVHAIAHTMGGFYNMPHGLANAIILPRLLRAYGKSVYKPLSKLAEIVKIDGASEQEKAENFITAIEKMNEYMQIPNHIDCIEEKDIPLMAERADSEANPLYPVPKLMNKKELEAQYFALMK